jgi:hypothetical protein
MPRENTVGAGIEIQATRDEVWRVWSEFGNVQDYVAGVPKSYLTGSTQEGIGTERRCEIGPKHVVDEKIAAWEDGSRYVFEVTRAKGVPIGSLSADCRVEGANGVAIATISVRYSMKGLIRFLPLRRAMQRQAADHLIGLKHLVETGEAVTPQLLKSLRKHYAGSLA